MPATKRKKKENKCKDKFEIKGFNVLETDEISASAKGTTSGKISI